MSLSKMCTALMDATATSIKRHLQLIAVVFLAALCCQQPQIAAAQSIRLTPEQERMLNSLPPDQQRQAREAIRQFQSQGSAGPAPTLTERGDSDGEEGFGFPPGFPLDAFFAEEDEEEPEAAPRSRVIISLTESTEPARGTITTPSPIREKIEGSNLYVLDESGILALPGFAPIPLLGLEEDEIQARLEAEDYISGFDVTVRLLGQEPIGTESLTPFGYSVFEGRDERETDFEAPSTGPVPDDYLLGPGDIIRVQLYGNVNSITDVEVSRDGTANVPELGPMATSGFTFSEFRKEINERVQQMLIGTQVSISLGQLRTIRVFVLGDVKEPGSYIVSATATVSSALYESGGVSQIGSLRNIQLKRKGRLVSRLDFYDLLLHGDTSNDRNLQPGDVVFVPPIGETVGIGGAVRRPAIYEVRQGATIGDVVQLAGGLEAAASAPDARLERIDINRERVVEQVDLTSTRAQALPARNGDTIYVPRVLPDFDKAVELAGHVYRPGTYPWRPGMRISDLIRTPAELREGVDMNYVLVRREPQRGQPVEAVSADLERALLYRGGPDDIALKPRDRVFVFSLEFGRQRLIDPLMEEIRLQATHKRGARQVQVNGYVRAPGTYPLEDGMRVNDLVRAGGNLAEEAYALTAELTRYTVEGGELRIVEVRDIDLDAAMTGSPEANILLQPYDYLGITRIPEWDTVWTISLEGEIRFPGNYRIRRGETLAEVIERAGGLTETAFPEGAVFLRESLKEREQEQIELLARRLEADLTTLSLQMAEEAGGSETLSTGQTLLRQLRETEATGRLVIGTEHLITADERRAVAEEIEVRDGDRLLIPRRSQVVTVLGETQQNTSHLYDPALSRDDYINLSGGFTRRADKRRVYIVRANGAVVAGSGSRWIGRSRADIRPGDTIVVPLDADRMRPLTFWTNVTQILYQGAIAIAAVQTFDN